MHCLYKLTFKTGKSYIGIAGNFDRRWYQHRRNARAGHDTLLCNALRKYGYDTVEAKVLAYGEKAYIAQLEIDAIRAFGTRYPLGYNVSFGGDVSPSSSPEAREKIRRSKLAHWQDPEYRLRRESFKTVMTPEQNARNQEAKLKNWSDPSYRLKCSEAHKGLKQSAETCARRSASLRKAWAEGRGAAARKAAMSGRIWINNGGEHRQLLPAEEIPAGWERGMLKKPASELRNPRRHKIYVVVNKGER